MPSQPDIDESNRLTQREFEHVRDFIILHFHATQRNDTPFRNYTRTMWIPETLQHKMELFQSQGRLSMKPRACRSGSLVPSDARPRPAAARIQLDCDVVDIEDMSTFIEGMRRAISNCIGAMPTHDEFLEKRCRRRLWRPSRTGAGQILSARGRRTRAGRRFNHRPQASASARRPTSAPSRRQSRSTGQSPCRCDTLIRNSGAPEYATSPPSTDSITRSPETSGHKPNGISLNSVRPEKALGSLLRQGGRFRPMSCLMVDDGFDRCHPPLAIDIFGYNFDDVVGRVAKFCHCDGPRMTVIGGDHADKEGEEEAIHPYHY